MAMQPPDRRLTRGTTTGESGTPLTGVTDPSAASQPYTPEPQFPWSQGMTEDQMGVTVGPNRPTGMGGPIGPENVPLSSLGTGQGATTQFPSYLGFLHVFGSQYPHAPAEVKTMAQSV